MAGAGELGGKLTEGDAIIEGDIAVAVHGYLRRVFHVGGRYFAEIEAWPDGYGLFIAPLRAVVQRQSGHVPAEPANRVEAPAASPAAV